MLKPIKGYEGLYSINENGRVYSYRSRKYLKWKIWTYHYVTLCRNKDDHKNRDVHRLIAETFLSNPENKEEVNHKDGNKLNNCLDNLEWATKSENMQHAFRVLKVMTIPDHRGEKHGLSKLTDQQVILMRQDHKQGLSYAKIGKKYGVCTTNARVVCSGITWTHIPMEC